MNFLWNRVESRPDLVCTIWMIQAPKKVFSILFFSNCNAELSEIVKEYFWSNMFSTCITFAFQNTSVCWGIWAYLHTSTVCLCKCDTLPKATMFNVYNFTGKNVMEYTFRNPYQSNKAILYCACKKVVHVTSCL